jgi:hypothetical protein
MGANIGVFTGAYLLYSFYSRYIPTGAFERSAGFMKVLNGVLSGFGGLEPTFRCICQRGILPDYNPFQYGKCHYAF